jgi:hypothetical protein
MLADEVMLGIKPTSDVWKLDSSPKVIHHLSLGEDRSLLVGSFRKDIVNQTTEITPPRDVLHSPLQQLSSCPSQPPASSG